jgi:hypothetical protein
MNYEELKEQCFIELNAMQCYESSVLGIKSCSNERIHIFIYLEVSQSSMRGILTLHGGESLSNSAKLVALVADI